MGTPYSEIDNMFLSEIKDDDLLIFDIEDREEIMDGLRRKAVAQFHSCKKDLSKNNEERCFEKDLTDEEMLIIATGMRVFWLNDKIYDLKLLKQRMTTKDWRMTSQAEHLRRLSYLKVTASQEFDRMKNQYTYYAY